MGNMMKVFLILMIVMSLLVLAGCQSEEVADPGTTTVPVEAGGETTEEPTTEKPVNIVEDPLGNGEGDPLDAIDGTTGESGPVIDIEIEEDAGSTTAPNQGGNTDSDKEDNVTEPPVNDDKDDDDLVVDFGDLVGKK